ncbi:MAG: 16S rRNA (guanine(527)-N(7))-methyltransferase RsmG [Pseudomonadota bacterium]
MAQYQALTATGDVSRETCERLQIYADQLTTWNRKINLVSPSTIPDLWTRHICDSVQLAALAKTPRTWIDLGSGAGLPGLLVAAVLQERNPGFQMTCVESDRRKAIFMIETNRKMGLDVNIVNKRIEALDETRYDVVSARALTDLSRLLNYADRLCAPDGICLFPKGSKANAELTTARSAWHMEAEKIPSLTDHTACILRIKEFSRVAD